MPAPPLLPGARTLIRNGAMQNDMDAQGFKIWNLDPTSLPPSSGPNPFPAVPHEWLNSYDSVGRNFTATQPNLLSDIAGFPSITGQSGRFLSNNGTALIWGVAPAAPIGIINVQNPPAGLTPAVGDGTTDDYPAIAAIITYATNHGGLTVYFPVGRYRVSQNLNLVHATSLVGDSPFLSIIAGDPGVSGPVILISTSPSDSPAATPAATGTVIQKLGVDCGASRASARLPSLRLGIAVYNTFGVYLLQCFVTNCSCFNSASPFIPGGGITVQNCSGITIRDCTVSGVGGYGISINGAPNSLLYGNVVNSATLSGIYAKNSPYCQIEQNQILSCGAASYGILCADADNSIIVGNSIQQCAIGIAVYSSSTRTFKPSSHGYVLSGNNVIRNYYGGIINALTNGTQGTGNLVSENGQGNTGPAGGGATYTVEPGITIDPAHAGSGYVVGDIITLNPASTRPAKAIVTGVLGGGAIASDGLFPVDMGSYTTFPSGSIPTTAVTGTGTGAQVFYTNTMVSSPGSGYQVGQVLVATNGTYYNPVRVLVTAVRTDGGVTGYRIVDGGGYLSTVTPPTTLNFGSDALSGPDTPASGGPVIPPSASSAPPASVFQLTPAWSLRYTSFNGGLPFGLATYGPCKAGSFNSNMIAAHATGSAVLVAEDVSGVFNGAATYLIVATNNLKDNLLGIRHKVGSTIDTNYNAPRTSLFSTNLIFPNTGETEF